VAARFATGDTERVEVKLVKGYVTENTENVLNVSLQ
jgi:hypothetical protein